MKKNYLFFTLLSSVSILSNMQEQNLDEEKKKILNNLTELKQEMITHQIETENKINQKKKEINTLHCQLKNLEITIAKSEVELASKAYQQEAKNLEKIKEKEIRKIQKMEKEKCQLQEEELKKINYLKTIQEKIKSIEIGSSN